MLKKLIGCEFRKFADILKYAYAFIGGIYILLLLSWLSDVEFLCSMFSLVLLIFSVLTVGITFLVLLLRFNRTVYGEAGYFTFSIPAKRNQIVFSKIAAAFLWSLIGSAVCVVNKVAIVFYGRLAMNSDANAFLAKFYPDSGFSISFMIFLFLFTVIILYYIITSITFSVSIGKLNIFSKRSALVSTLAFVIINVICSFAGLLLSGRITMGIQVSGREGILFEKSTFLSSLIAGHNVSSSIVGFSGLFLILIAAILMHVITVRLINNNLDVK